MTKKKNDNILKQSFVTQTHGYLDVFPKRELWKQIGEDFNGQFKISHNSGNELEILKLYIPYEKYEIKLTESDTRPLKFEIEFNSISAYKLILGWEDSIEKILKRLGKKEIEIGIKEFDKKYLIQSKYTDETINLLSEEIIEYILKYNVYSISYITEKNQQKSKLTSVISRTINDKKTIKDLIILHEKIIDKLKEQTIIL